LDRDEFEEFSISPQRIEAFSDAVFAVAITRCSGCSSAATGGFSG
jgi:hypothetical protein